MRRLLTITMLAALVAACGSSTDDTPDDEAPAFDTAAYAASIDTAVSDGLGGQPPSARCDATAPTWHCYYDGIEAQSDAQVRIILTTPGDISRDQAQADAEQARLAVWNFAGPAHPDLDTVVTYTNGRDTGTTFRRDVPLLN